MSGSETSHTITSAPYALPLPLDAPGGAQQASSGSAAVKEEVIANGSIVPPTAAVKRKLDPQEEAKLREVEYKKRVNQAATLDRMRALQPDYETPFNYPNDALQRLLCYHVFTSSQASSDPKVDEDEWKKEFNSKAIECSARLEKIKAQYEKHLLRAPSQPKEEKILLNKLSYFDEKFEVESLKTKLGIAAKPAAITPMARTAPSPMTPSSMPRPSMASPPPRVGTAVPSMAKPSVPASPHSVTPSAAPKPAAAASAAHAHVSHAAHSAQAAHAAHSAHTTHTAHVPASHARMGPAAHAAANAAPAPAPAPTPLPLPTHSAPAPAPAPVVAVVQTSSDGAPVIVLASTR